MNPISWATSYFISKYLRPFVPEIDSDHIRMSLWSGRLELSDLDLRIPWTSSPKSILRITRAYLKHVEIRIPWQKLLKRTPCIINVEATGLELEFEVCSSEFTPQDLENYKASVLKELDNKIRELKKSVENNIVSKAEDGGLMRTIVSSLRVSMIETKASFKDMTAEKKSEGFEGKERDDNAEKVRYCIEIYKIDLSPCNYEFVPLEENPQEEIAESTGKSILDTVRAYLYTRTRFDEIIPEIQFKLLQVSNLRVYMILEPETCPRMLLNSLDITTSIRLKHILTFTSSLSNTSISFPSHLSPIHLSANNQELKILTNFLTSLPNLHKKSSNLARSPWQRVLKRCIQHSNKRSWYIVYRELLFRRVYKELYTKHVQNLNSDRILLAQEVRMIEELYKETNDRDVNILVKLAARELIFYYNKGIERTDEACKRVYEEKIGKTYVRNYYSTESVEIAMIKEIEKLMPFKYLESVRQELKQTLKVSSCLNSQPSSNPEEILSVVNDVEYSISISGLSLVLKTDNSIFSDTFYTDSPKLRRYYHQSSTISKPLILIESSEISLSGNYSATLLPPSFISFTSLLKLEILIEDLTIYNMHIHDLNNSLFKKVLYIKQPTSISLLLRTNSDTGFLTHSEESISIKIVDIDISINKPLLQILYRYLFSILQFPSFSKYSKESEFLNLIQLPKLSKFKSRNACEIVVDIGVRRLTVMLCEKYGSDIDAILMEVSKIKTILEKNDLKNRFNAEVRMKYLAMVAGKASHWNPEHSEFENSPLLQTYKLNLDLMKIQQNSLKMVVRGRVIDIQLASASLISLKRILDQWLTDPIKLPRRPADYQILRINSVTPTSLPARGVKILSLHINFDGISLHADVKNSSIAIYMKAIEIYTIKRFFESCIVLQLSEMSVIDQLASKTSENILARIHLTKNPKISSISPENYLVKEGIPILPGKAGFFILKSYRKESFEYRNILNEFEIGLGEIYINAKPELIHIWISVIYEFVNLLSGKYDDILEEFSQVIKHKFVVHVHQGSICFEHKNSPIYLLCFRDLISSIDLYSSHIHARAQATDLHFSDLSLPSSYHSEIISPSNPDSSFELNFSDFTEKLLQIRLKNLNIIYLNRVLNEVYELFANYYPFILSQPYRIDELGLKTSASYESSISSSTSELLQIQILALSCTVKVPRNSASKGEHYKLNIEKVMLGSSDNMFFIDQKFDWERECDLKDTFRTELSVCYINSIRYLDDLKRFAALELRNENLTILKQFARKIQERMNREEEQMDEFEPVLYNGFDVYYAKVENRSYTSSENILTSDVESFKVIHENINAVRNLSLSQDSEFSERIGVQDKKINPFIVQKSQEDIISEDSSKPITIQFCNVSISDSYKYITDIEDKLNFDICIITDDTDPLSSQESFTTILINFTSRVFLEFFEDQYNLLIKTLTENFTENCISVLPLNPTRLPRDLITINIQITFNNTIELSTYQNKLYECYSSELKDAPWKMNDLQAKKGLSDIELNDLMCKVHLYENGKKEIFIACNSVNLIDSRYFSQLINLGKIHWLYHSDEGEESHESAYETDQLRVVINFESNGDTFYEIFINESVLLIVPDLINEVRLWFSAPFDTNSYPNPSYVLFKPCRNPPSLRVSIIFKNFKLCLFESFENPYRNNCIFYIDSADFGAIWTDDCVEGPGSIDMKFKIDIASVYFLDTRGEKLNRAKTDQSILRSFKLEMDYSNFYTAYFKPNYRSPWVSSQINVRFPNEASYQVIVIVSFKTIRWVTNCLEAMRQGSLSIKPKPRSHQDLLKRATTSQSKLPLSRKITSEYYIEPGKESNRLSLSFSLHALSFTFTNEKEQPIFKCMIPDLRLGYNNETKKSIEDASLAIELNASYFNHRVMSWEPFLQTTRFEARYGKNEGEVYLDIEDCGEGISLYVTPSLLENVSTVHSYFSLKDVESVRHIVSNTPYRLFNKTGLDIMVEMNQDDWLYPIARYLQHNSEETIDEDILNKVGKKSKNTQDELGITGLFDRKTIDVQFIDNEKLLFDQVFKIGVDTPDIHISPLNICRSKLKYQADHNMTGRFSLVYPRENDDKGCLKWIHKKRKKDPDESSDDETVCLKYFLVTEIEWIPETSQKRIWLRSSITVTNSTPNHFKVNYKLKELEYKTEHLAPWDKNFVPIPAMANGKLMIWPLLNYRYTKKITFLNLDDNKLISRKVCLSSTSGLLSKQSSKLITIRESGKDSVISLSFVPLICQQASENKFPISLTDSHFYIALSLKKINHSGSTTKHKRSLEHEKLDRLSTVPTKNEERLKTLRNSLEDQIYKAECIEDDLLMNEYELILTSIFSVVNATPFSAKVTVSSKYDKSPAESTHLAQGETYHCYFVKFFSEIAVQVEIQNCEVCEEFRFSLLKIKKDVKHVVKSIDKVNRDNEFYLWMQICKDEMGCWQMRLYFPYWILNKTGQDLLFAEYERWRTDKITKNPEANNKALGTLKEISYSLESDESGLENQSHAYLKREDSKPEESHEFKLIRMRRSEGNLDSLYKAKSKDYSPHLPIILEKPLRKIETHTNTYHRKSFRYQSQTTEREYDSTWQEIEIFSPSKKITKIKVAIKSPIDDKPVSGWSKYFSLGSSGTSGYLEVKTNGDDIFHFGVTIQKGQGIFDLTNIITFKPLYILLNSYSQPLVYKQEGCSKYYEIPTGQHTPFYWPMRHNKRVLRVALAEELASVSDFRWSGAFSIDTIGENFIRLPGSKKDSDKYLQVSVVESEPVMVINFTAQKSSLPYRLINHTPYELIYTQNSNEENKGTIQTRRLEPRIRDITIQDYAWDEPVGWHEFIIQIQNTTKIIYADRICRYEPIEISFKNWNEMLENMKSMSGKLYIKSSKILQSERNCCLSGRVLYFDKPYKKVKELKLDNGCCDMTIVDELNFNITRCKTTYYFKAPSVDECSKWTRALQDAIYNTSYSTSQQVYIEIELQEATRVIHFKNFTGFTANLKDQHDKNCYKLLDKTDEEYDISSKARYNLKISSINISLINSAPQEVLRCSFDRILFDYTLFQEDSVGITLLVKFFKIDNQLLKCMSQVAVVSRSRLNTNSGNELKVTDLNNIFLFVMKKTTQQIHNISNFNFLIQPFDVHVDDALIEELVEYFQTMTKILYYKKAKTDRVQEHANLRYTNIIAVSASQSIDFLTASEGHSLIPKDLILSSEKRIFIENFSIEKIQFSLVIEKNTSQKRGNRPKNLMSSIAGLGLTFTTIDASDLTLNKISFESIFLPTSKFTSVLVSHYRSQAIRKVYNILGSFDLLGNPSSLLTSITQGFKELIINPYHTLINKPKDFVLSIGKGTGGMVRHTVSGVLKSVGNISGFIGRGIALLSLDKHFLKIQMSRKYRKPKNFQDVIWTGMKQLGNGMVEGLTGVVVCPIRDTRKTGLPGVVTGLGKGLIGTLTKPAAGIFDGISSAASGLGNLARQTNGPHLTERTRYPLPFYRDKVLFSYNEKVAAGQYYLSNFSYKHAREKILFYYMLYRKKIPIALVIIKHAICVIRCKGFKGVALYKDQMKEMPFNEIETKQIYFEMKASSISLTSLELKHLNLIRLKSANKKKMKIFLRYDSIQSQQDIEELAWVMRRYFVRTLSRESNY
jgi:hypothetical protein